MNDMEKTDLRKKPLLDYTPEPPVWTDKKRPFFGLPLSFTRYTLYPDRLIIETGILTTRQEELRLYRIQDITLRMGLFQRLFGVGSIHMVTNDATSPKCLIQDVLQPRELVRIISDLAESERNRVRISFMECI